MLKHSNAGFTLIEFLVASALAVIVIMAAGSTYLLTRKLNDGAQSRIDIQNNMRIASLMLMRDAREAGSFGCFTTGGVPSDVVEKAGDSGVSPKNLGSFPNITKGGLYSNGIKLDGKEGGYGVVWKPSLSIQTVNDTNTLTDVLLFVYGKDSGGVDITKLSSHPITVVGVSQNSPELVAAAEAKAEMVLSSCYDSYSFIASGLNQDQVTTTTSSTLVSKFPDRTNTLSVSQLYGVAYGIQTINQVASLVRYDIGSDGEWRGPQVLANNVSSMSASFAYVQNCDESVDIPNSGVDFVYSKTPIYNNLPALIQVKLTYKVGEDDNNIVESDYLINASVRGGNICSTISKFDS